MVRVHPAVPIQTTISVGYGNRHSLIQNCHLERTCCGPRRPKFFRSAIEADSMPKDRKIIELARITTVFNDSCILKLASVAKLAAGADLDALGWWIREAAELFVLESRIPTRNDLHREIAALYQAASRRDFDRAAQLRDMLSPEALVMIRVPDTAELKEASTHVEAKADRRRHRSSQVPERFVLPAAGELRDQRSAIKHAP